jgi:hypothetical protein
MAKAANGRMYDVPCEAEIKLFKEKGTLFQPIFLVLSIAHLKDDNGSYAIRIVAHAHFEAWRRR